MERGSGHPRRPSQSGNAPWRRLAAAAALAAAVLISLLGTAGAALGGVPAPTAYAPSADNGTITVESAPDGASFTISGPEDYSGRSPATFPEAPAGSYTVTWHDMDGHITPSDQTMTLNPGGSITFSGVYDEAPPQTGTIGVTSTPSGASFTIEGPQDYSGRAPATFPEAPAAEYTVTWGDMDGYVTPPTQTRELEGGGSITFRGTYDEVPPQTGTIAVASTPSGASFTISGPEDYSGRAPETFRDAPPGTYTITWGDMDGYVTPPTQTRELEGGGSTIFRGTYDEAPPQTGTIAVASTPSGASFTINGPEDYSGRAPETFRDAPPGTYTITWGDMEDYTTPPPQTRTLNPGGSITFTGSYGADTAPPRISGLKATAITASGATITWTTNEPATGQVQYGATAFYGQTTRPGNTLTESHSVALTGLVHGMVYHYRVTSSDARGNSATSGDYTFTTLDVMPPSIARVTSVDVTPASCNITWTTDEPADSQVEYGQSITYGFLSGPDTALVTSHRVALTGLSPGTWYSYRVLSRDAAGNLARSERYEFLTSDDTPPVISSVIVTDITSASATIRWETDERASSLVEYGLTGNCGSSSPADTEMLFSHSVTLTGLASQTTYHYRVRSADHWGNSTRSPDAAFTTMDVDAPVISGVTASGITDRTATIVWTTDSPSQGSVEYGLTSSYGLVSTYDNSTVTRHSVTLSDLAAQTTYHFKVKSRDASGLWAESADGTFVTGVDMGPDPPRILYLHHSSLTSSGITVYWNTDEPATARVEYGLTRECSLSRAADGGMSTDHAVSLAGLKSGTTYHYRVVATDAAGNQSVSQEKTFSTPIGRAPLPSLPAWAWGLAGTAGALLVAALVVKNR